MPNSSTCLDWAPILEWLVVRCGSKNGHQKKTMVFIRDWTMTLCPTCVIHSRLHISEQTGDDPYDHFMNNRNPHFDNE
jgi:hypothetical protein